MTLRIGNWRSVAFTGGSILSLVCLLLWPVARAAATPDAVGFSGAPGTHGSCAVHCHGQLGGTIVVSGFPHVYVPSDTYLVHVAHNGGEPISNFNASVRQANDTPCAGTLVPGPNMELYSSGTDSIGIHFTVPDQDSGWFLWIAPDPGLCVTDTLGDVELYLSGMQGLTMDGLSTLVRLTATKSPTGWEEQPAPVRIPVRFELVNRVVADLLILRVRIPDCARARIAVLTSTGRRVAMIADGLETQGEQSIWWQPKDARGRTLAPGDYFAVLTAAGHRLFRRFTVVR